MCTIFVLIIKLNWSNLAMLDALYTTTPAHLTWRKKCLTENMKLNLLSWKTQTFREKQEIRFLSTEQFVVLLLIGVKKSQTQTNDKLILVWMCIIACKNELLLFLDQTKVMFWQKYVWHVILCIIRVESQYSAWISNKNWYFAYNQFSYS